MCKCTLPGGCLGCGKDVDDPTEVFIRRWQLCVACYISARTLEVYATAEYGWDMVPILNIQKDP